MEISKSLIESWKFALQNLLRKVENKYKIQQLLNELDVFLNSIYFYEIPRHLSRKGEDPLLSKFFPRFQAINPMLYNPSKAWKLPLSP